jgi:hypothetical protein
MYPSSNQEMVMPRLIVTLNLTAVGLWMAGADVSMAQTRPNEIRGVGATQIHVLAGSTHGQKLTAVSGTGEGIVNVSPEASRDGFSVEIQVTLWRTSPNTTFNVTRAVDFSVDGICTNNQFVQFPLPNPGPLATLTTSPGGAGSIHIPFERPQIADGAMFDVQFEVSSEDQSVVLRTECFTVVAK